MQTPQTTPTGQGNGQLPRPQPQVQPQQTQPQWQPQPQVQPQQNIQPRNHYHEAGVPAWGVLLIVIGALALLSNLGWDLGWLFGLALGAWLVYLGVRRAQVGEPVNWWLVGFGLLIGLGSISTGFTDKLVFPAVLIIVGVGILAQQTLLRPKQ